MRGSSWRRRTGSETKDGIHPALRLDVDGGGVDVGADPVVCGRHERVVLGMGADQIPSSALRRDR